MSGTNVIPGSIAKVPLNPGQPGPWVGWQFPHNGRVNTAGTTIDKLDGAFMAQPLPASPTNVEAWEITGFSCSMRIAANIDFTGAQAITPWARFGDIWAGVIKDIPIPTPQPNIPVWPAALFPPDLSSFSKVWDGANDEIRRVNAEVTAYEKVENFQLVAQSTVLPFPIIAEPGSQLAFAVIMTPSIVDATVDFIFRDIDFAVNYNTRKR